MPGSPYGAAYTNPMNDLERRMDNVDLSRGRGASVGEYNSKQRRTRTPRPPLLILVLVMPNQDHHIKARSRLHRPTWARQTSDIRPPKAVIRTPPTRRPGMAPTYTVLPLRSAAQPAVPSRRPSCRAPGPPRPIPWVDPLGYTARDRAPRHPFPAECPSGTGPGPRRPTRAVPQANTLNNPFLVPARRRPFPEERHLLTTHSLASHTLIPFRGPRITAAVCPWVAQSLRGCCLHPTGSAVPRIWLSRTPSSTP